MIRLDDPTLVIYGDADKPAGGDEEKQLQQFYTLWCNKTDLNFTVTLNRKYRFRAHEHVLRTNRYFAILFRSRALGTKRHTNIDYDVISERAFAAVLEYWYTRTLALTDDNIDEVAVTAAYLLDSAALEHCVEHLCRNLTLEKAVGGLELAIRHKIDALKERTLLYISERFEVLVEEHRCLFVGVSLEALSALVESSELVVYNEDVVLRACCVWLAAAGAREASTSIFRSVRFQFLTRAQSSQPHIDPDFISALAGIERQQAGQAPKPPRHYWNGLYMVATDGRVHHYSPERNAVREVARVTDDDVSTDGVIALDGSFYFIGESALKRFDPRTNTMTSSQLPEEVTMERFCACAHERKLYIFTTEGIHIYTPETDNWSVLEADRDFIGEDAPTGTLFATSFYSRYILFGDCAVGGHTPLLLVDPHDGAVSNVDRFALPRGFYYRLVTYKSFLLFFGVSKSAARSNILMVHDIDRELAVCCGLDDLFVSCDANIRRCHFVFFFHRFKLQRHGDYIYFLEHGKERYAPFKEINSVKKVNLEELLRKVWEPDFNFSSICHSVDIDIGLTNFELLSL